MEETEVLVAPPDEQAPVESLPKAEVGTEPPAEVGTTPEEVVAPPAEEPAPSEPEGVAELDDETLDALVEVYGDKLLTSKKLQQQVNRLIQEQVTQQVTERTRTLETQGEVASLMERGRQAVVGLTGLAEAAKSELTKARAGEDFNPDVFKPEAFASHLSNYGQAIVAEVSGRYDRAIQNSITTSLTQRLPELTEDQAQKFYQIVQTAQRMEGDPRQRANAKDYFVDNVVAFLMERSLEAGAIWERERASKHSQAAEKIAQANAIKAAAARLAKDKAPPLAPSSLPQTAEPTGAFSREYYRELKAKNPKEAQAYVDRFAASQRVPALPAIG